MQIDNSDLQSTRERIFLLTEGYFVLDKFSPKYQKSVKYKNDSVEEVAEVYVDTEDNGVMIVFLPAKGVARYCFFKQSCRSRSKSFHRDVHSSTVAYRCTVGHYDAYEEAKIVDESFGVIYHVGTGRFECEMDF